LQAQRFDVVLTDISMPGLNGKELLAKVVELYPGHAGDYYFRAQRSGAGAEFDQVGAFDYLLKPFRLEVVEEKREARH
jgi:CheY-like chemotaxis protein